MTEEDMGWDEAKELEWDENHGYAEPVFSISVSKSGRIWLDCYDEYAVVLSDKGLETLKEAVDLAYSRRAT